MRSRRRESGQGQHFAAQPARPADDPPTSDSELRHGRGRWAGSVWSHSSRPKIPAPACARCARSNHSAQPHPRRGVPADGISGHRQAIEGLADYILKNAGYACVMLVTPGRRTAGDIPETVRPQRTLPGTRPHYREPEDRLRGSGAERDLARVDKLRRELESIAAMDYFRARRACGLTRLDSRHKPRNASCFFRTGGGRHGGQ